MRHFDSVRVKTRLSVLRYARKEGLEREMDEVVVRAKGLEPSRGLPTRT